jgi:hypothetical protein
MMPNNSSWVRLVFTSTSKPGVCSRVSIPLSWRGSLTKIFIKVTASNKRKKEIPIPYGNIPGSTFPNW